MCIWTCLFAIAAFALSIASYKRLTDIRESIFRMQKYQNINKITHPEEITQHKDLMRNMESMLQQILNVVVYDQKHTKDAPKKKKPPAK